MKNLFLASLVIFATGCSSIGKYVPSEFDNVEYGKLVELNVISVSHNSIEDWCNKGIINQMNYRAKYLHTYAKHRLNENIVNVYSEIHKLTDELKQKEEPSQAYCKIKRTNIHNITTNTLNVFGDRK
jgi:hypothetical protein